MCLGLKQTKPGRCTYSRAIKNNKSVICLKRSVIEKVWNITIQATEVILGIVMVSPVLKRLFTLITIDRKIRQLWRTRKISNTQVQFCNNACFLLQQTWVYLTEGQQQQGLLSVSVCVLTIYLSVLLMAPSSWACSHSLMSLIVFAAREYYQEKGHMSELR